jgi:hypothetical protein
MLKLSPQQQKCDQCGWLGQTRALQVDVLCRASYLAMAVIAIGLDLSEVVPLGAFAKSAVPWIVLIGAIAVSELAWRTNTCPQCKVRMGRKTVGAG